MKKHLCFLLLFASCSDSYVSFDTPVFSTKIPDGWKEKRNIQTGSEGEMVLTKTKPKRMLDIRWGSSVPRSDESLSEYPLLGDRAGTFIVSQEENQLRSGAFVTVTTVYCSKNKHQFTINTAAKTESAASALRDKVLSESRCKDEIVAKPN